MLFQIVVTFGSVWTKCAEELRLGLVRVHVRAQERLLLEEFLAQITDEGLLVGRRPSSLRNILASHVGDGFPPMIQQVVFFSKLPGTKKDCATTAHKELIVDARLMFGN